MLLGSCVSLHDGLVAPNSVNVNSPNFKVVKTIYGQATATSSAPVSIAS